MTNDNDNDPQAQFEAETKSQFETAQKLTREFFSEAVDKQGKACEMKGIPGEVGMMALINAFAEQLGLSVGSAPEKVRDAVQNQALGHFHLNVACAISNRGMRDSLGSLADLLAKIAKRNTTD